ncbi:MAG: DEAD/DEAH box helicase, partial [Bacteroidales bacterium]|nr:DEAD/DEAH box helicase [Bacteroidales bacterium]
MERITMESFRKLGITKPILKSIVEQRFENPTEIQEKAIPLILAGNDVIAGSSTGSGKTLAFAIGILQNSIKGNGVQALVLTPTRELAEQVASSLRQFSKYRPLEVVAVYGGIGINPQIKALKTADVVVGTPGRLLDHLARKTLKLDNIETLVLDEADRMFDMGFKNDVEKII